MSTNTKELKSLLHESIENIDDEGFLQTIKNILDRKYEPKEDISLTSYQEKRIDQAKKSIRQGDFLTNNQADQLVAKWLNNPCLMSFRLESGEFSLVMEKSPSLDEEISRLHPEKTIGTPLKMTVFGV